MFVARNFNIMPNGCLHLIWWFYTFLPCWKFMPGLSENWIDGSLGGSNQQILHIYFLIYLTWFAFRLNPRSGEFKSLLCKISFSGLWLRYDDRNYFKQCFASLKIGKQTNINNQYLTTITSKSCVVRRTSFLYLRTWKAQVTCASAQSSNLVVFRLSQPVPSQHST